MGKLTTEQFGLLEVLTYLDNETPFKKLENVRKGMTIGEFLREININKIEDDKVYHSYITGKDWKHIIDMVMKDEKLRDMKILETGRDLVYGGESVLFVDDSNSADKEAVVAFRGTAPAEWADNIEGATNMSDEPSTECQKRALNWYKEMYKQHNLGDYENRNVIGHSKGGNKAKYITIMDPTVTNCVSFDGQGFCDEFVEKYAENIAKNQRKITNHNVDHDFVNILLNDVGEKHFYKGFNVGSFARNHCPHVFFKHDEEKPVMEKSKTGRVPGLGVVHDLINSFCRTLAKDVKKKTIGTLSDIVGSLFKTMEDNKEIEAQKSSLEDKNPQKIKELDAQKKNVLDIVFDKLKDRENVKNLGRLVAYAGKFIGGDKDRFKKISNFVNELSPLKGRLGMWFMRGLAKNGFRRWLSRRVLNWTLGKEKAKIVDDVIETINKTDTKELEIKDGKDLDAETIVMSEKAKKLGTVYEKELAPELNKVNEAIDTYTKNIEAAQVGIRTIIEKTNALPGGQLTDSDNTDLRRHVATILANKSIQIMVDKNAPVYDKETLERFRSEKTISAAIKDIENSAAFNKLMELVDVAKLESLAVNIEGSNFPVDSVNDLHKDFMKSLVVKENNGPEIKAPEVKAAEKNIVVENVDMVAAM